MEKWQDLKKTEAEMRRELRPQRVSKDTVNLEEVIAEECTRDREKGSRHDADESEFEGTQEFEYVQDV